MYELIKDKRCREHHVHKINEEQLLTPNHHYDFSVIEVEEDTTKRNLPVQRVFTNKDMLEILNSLENGNSYNGYAICLIVASVALVILMNVIKK